MDIINIAVKRNLACARFSISRFILYILDNFMNTVIVFLHSSLYIVKQCVSEILEGKNTENAHHFGDFLENTPEG